MTPALIARLTDSPPAKIICAWCTPRVDLDRLNRQFPGQISHSMCRSCAAKVDSEIAAAAV